mgnify:CR=1 FL=1
MSWPLTLAAVWVLAATVTALLPMRRQYLPGVTLLILAPLLILWLSIAHGWWIGVLALFAFVSMFRNPLKYLIARLRGERPELPK